MPHLRQRYLEDNLKKCMNYSGLVGLLGHRQVGKTTLMGKLCHRYFILDLQSERQEAEQNPSKYLENRSGSWTGLDEVQTVPELFPELKEWVRTHKEPGQFVLSGSVRFSSREAIRESLTGRIINLELLPLVTSELLNLPLARFCYQLLQNESVDGVRNWPMRTSSELKVQHKTVFDYFNRGGLPGICFIRDDKLRSQKIHEQLNTMLDRDLRLVKKIQLSLSDLSKILSSLASLQGVPMDYTRIRRETGISTVTIKKVIFGMEAIFLIRTVPIEGSISGNTIYFEDQAEHQLVVGRELDFVEKLTHFCFTNLRAQFEYRLGNSTRIFQYRTRGGAYVPIAFKSKDGCLGIIPVPDPGHIRSILGSVNSFLKSYSRSKVLIVFPEAIENGKFMIVQPQVLAIPLGQVL